MYTPYELQAIGTQQKVIDLKEQINFLLSYINLLESREAIIVSTELASVLSSALIDATLLKYNANSEQTRELCGAI